MKSICITGIGGYLGLATAFKLIEMGHVVVGIGSHPDRPNALPGGVIYAGIDIRDTATLTTFFTEHNVGTVYHFAAIKYVGKCEADPELCFGINTDGTTAVLDAMAIAGVPHIIYASTYAVYDWSGDQLLLSEVSATNPKTVYGASKLKSEAQIITYAAQGKIERYHILRYANIVGAIPELPAHLPQSFLDKIILATQTDDTITINGDSYNTDDGSVARDFVDIRDVVSAHVLVLSSPKSATYTVSSAVATTLKSLIAQAENISQANIATMVTQAGGTEPSSITISHAQITSELGWNPTYTLPQTIELLYKRLTA